MSHFCFNIAVIAIANFVLPMQFDSDTLLGGDPGHAALTLNAARSNETHHFVPLPDIAQTNQFCQIKAILPDHFARALATKRQNSSRLEQKGYQIPAQPRWRGNFEYDQSYFF
jgi:hypothetical protein